MEAISIIPGGGIRVGDLSSFKIIKGVAIDIDHRLRTQQYTSQLPFNGIKGGRKTSCMACQQKNLLVAQPAEWLLVKPENTGLNIVVGNLIRHLLASVNFKKDEIKVAYLLLTAPKDLKCHNS